MNPDCGVVGVFDTDSRAAEAVGALRELGHTDLRVYSPVSSHALLRALGEEDSAVSFFTLAGAVAGVLLGFGLSAYAALRWNLLTSGKPVLAWIAFLVVAFELTVLLGALGNFASMLFLSGLGRFRTPPGYDSSFSRDRFGVFTPCDVTTFNTIREAMEGAGALEIREVRAECVHKDGPD